MKKKKINVHELIEEGNRFNFENNKKFSHGQFFSEASFEFLAWISKVEDYINSNFEETSGPNKMIITVNKRKFSGYHQSDFDTELNKIKGAISSCSSLNPNKKSQDNQILNLLKNPIFWTVISIVFGISYNLGYDNGNSKFDIEKIEMNKENNLYKDSINTLNRKIQKLNKK